MKLKSKLPVRSGTLPVVCAVVVLLLGCASDKKPQKPQVTQQWNRARANVMLGLAKNQYATGNFDPARKTVNEALGLDPENASGRILSAKLAIEAGQIDLADKELEKARKIDPKNAEADYLSGVVYQRWQKPDVACGYYTSASDKEPGELAYLLARSEMLVDMNRQEEALRLLQEKVVYFENSAVIRDAVGQLLMQFKQYDEAADVLRQASVLATDDMSVREHAGIACYFAKRYAEAAEQLQRVLKHEKFSGRADLWLVLGRSQLEAQKTRDARASLERAAQLDDTVAATYLTLGRAAMQLGDTKRAELSLKRAIALEPTSSESRLMLGYLRLRQGKLDEALSNFQKSNALDTSDTTSLCMIGYTLQRLGRSAEASRYYVKALKIKPSDDMARKLLASVDVND